MDVSGEFYFATVGEVTDSPQVHVLVYPGDDGETVEEELPHPSLLVLLQNEAGRWGLHCYDRSGEFAGDSEHANYDEAVAHSKWAYGEAVGEWQRVVLNGSVDNFVRAKLGCEDA